MSLFAAHGWWRQAGRGSSDVVDRGCLLVGDVLGDCRGKISAAMEAARAFVAGFPANLLAILFNNIPPPDVIVTGSLCGVLQLVRPQAGDFKPEHVLLETRLSQAILQLALGSFISFVITAVVARVLSFSFA
jgi:hypothetical protein